MAHPAHKIKLNKGDLILLARTGNILLLVERFKGDGGHYYWKLFPTRADVGSVMMAWKEGALKVVRETSLRHNLYGRTEDFKLIKKVLDK